MKLGKIKKLIVVSALTCALAACVSSDVFTGQGSVTSGYPTLSTSLQNRLNQIQKEHGSDPEYFAGMINSSNNAVINNEYILKASKLYIEQQKFGAAQHYLGQYVAGISSDQDGRFSGLDFTLKNQINKGSNVQSSFDESYPSSKSAIQSMLNSNDYYTALSSTNQLYPQLNDSNKRDLVAFTWLWIKSLSPEALNNINRLANNNSNANVGLWVDLANLHKANRGNVDELITALKLWNSQAATTAHPASLTPPSELSAFNQSTNVSRPDLYAALPLTGNLKTYGVAIKKGIEAAKETTNGEAKVIFVDTYHYDQAINIINKDRSLGIIGPLDSNTITQFANEGHSNRILALNSSAVHSCSLNFAKSDQYQAISAANFLSSKGFKNPLIIANSSQSSLDAAQAFENQWIVLKSSHPTISRFNIVDDVKLLVQNALNQTPAPDVIYFLGKNKEVISFATIMNNSFIEANLSIMTNNHVITDDFTRGVRTDLEAFYFTADNLVINKDSIEGKKATRSLGRSVNSLYRMYSLGYDSFVAMQNLDKLRSVPNYKVDALGSRLYNLGNCEIARDFYVYQLKSGNYNQVN